MLKLESIFHKLKSSIPQRKEGIWRKKNEKKEIKNPNLTYGFEQIDQREGAGRVQWSPTVEKGPECVGGLGR